MSVSLVPKVYFWVTTTHLIHRYVERCVSGQLRPGRTGAGDDEGKGDVVFLEHWVVRDVGPHLSGTVRRVVGKEVCARCLVKEVVREHSRPPVRYARVTVGRRMGQGGLDGRRDGIRTFSSVPLQRHW